ncbi:hypothetical protein P1P68_10955 [Streptomyces scabiei]|uniref:hypothetical protein n=1 Tax=Streptomyces scabiei TaxID=1930 RepID=UPI00299051A9|nr:hypothetical protein [Streptomyces scabiei]MDW8805286.1 hypothetical protein [Streptomyces scabiei]
MTRGVEGAAGALRPARAAVFAAVCVVATALGHAVISGDTLPWWAVGVAFAGTASGAWWLTGRERGAAAVVGATVVAQGLLHLLFSLSPRLMAATDAATGGPGATGATGATGASGTSHGVEISHSGMAMHHAGAHSEAMGAPADDSLWAAVTHGGSVGMLLAHLLAALACGVWLWRGEAAVHRITMALAAVLFAPLRRVCRVLFRTAARHEVPSRGAVVSDGENRRPVTATLRHAVVRRGPPRDQVTFSRPSPVSPLAAGP